MKEQETVIKRTEQLDIDGMICELLQEQCTDGENVKFTNRAVDLIHKISEKCQVIPIVKETQEQAKDYAEEMTAEQIYLDIRLLMDIIVGLGLGRNHLLPCSEVWYR